MGRDWTFARLASRVLLRFDVIYRRFVKRDFIARSAGRAMQPRLLPPLAPLVPSFIVSGISRGFRIRRRIEKRGTPRDETSSLPSIFRPIFREGKTIGRFRAGPC